MATLDVTAFDAMMKEIYPNIRIMALSSKKRPLLEWMPKADVFEGDAYIVPQLYEDPQSANHQLSKAITQAETSKQVKFVLTDSDNKEDYGVVKIAGKAIHMARSNMGSFIRAKDTQIQGILRQLGKRLHLELYRGTSASKGQIAAGGIDGTGTILALTNKSDVHNFGVGQTLIANVTDDAVTMKTGGVKVTKRSVSGGTITVDTDVTGLGTAWAAGDYLFSDGDEGSGLSGLSAWLPLTEPSTSDSFFTVNRSTDVTRLSGHRVDNSGRTILENAQELAMLISEEGGDPDTLFLNPRAGLQLSSQTEAKVDRVNVEGGSNAKIGFSGFQIYNFVTGPLNVVFDVGCPPNRGYMLQRSAWKVIHTLGLPHIITDDGNRALRGSTTDDIEVRARRFCNLTCEAPAWNGVMSVATT